MTTDHPVCEYHYARTRRGAVAAVAEIRELAEKPCIEHDPWATDWRGNPYVYVKDILQILERHGCG